MERDERAFFDCNGGCDAAAVVDTEEIARDAMLAMAYISTALEWLIGTHHCWAG
jgi:hypothetical protein